jgi:hypothetical protein
MNIQEVQEVLSLIKINSSSQIVGVDWDVKLTKIYGDGGVVLEKGYCIRTTFMRPDINTGEIEKGYGRWMYVPENISTDGLVKTAWVCVDLIVKHELMEAFLYDNTKIFDPHKSIKNLQYNGTSTTSNEGVVSKNPTVDQGDMVIKTEKTKSSGEVFHKQNLGNHVEEITDYLNNFLTKRDNSADSSMGESIEKYIVLTNTVFHEPKKGMIRLTNSNGQITDYRAEERYTLSDVKDMLGDMVAKSYIADTAVVNQLIYGAGFTEGKPNEDVWVFKNPNIKHRFVVHSEIDKSLAIINQHGDFVNDDKGDLMVYEKESYNMDNIKRVLALIRK